MNQEAIAKLEIQEAIAKLKIAETCCLCTDDRLKPLKHIQKALEILKQQPAEWDDFKTRLHNCEERLAILETEIANASDDLKNICWRLGMTKSAIIRKIEMNQQPAAGEFTEKLRRFVKLYENEVPRRAEITFLEEAYNHLLRVEATNKDLLEACKESQKAIMLLYECNKDVEIALGSGIQLKKAEKLLDAAIAKAKKEAK